MIDRSSLVITRKKCEVEISEKRNTCTFWTGKLPSVPKKYHSSAFFTENKYIEDIGRISTVKRNRKNTKKRKN